MMAAVRGEWQEAVPAQPPRVDPVPWHGSTITGVCSTLAVDVTVDLHMRILHAATGTGRPAMMSRSGLAATSYKGRRSGTCPRRCCALVNYCLQQGIALPPGLRKSRVRTVA